MEQNVPRAPQKVFSLMPDFKVRNTTKDSSPVSTHHVIFPPNFAFVWGFSHVLFIYLILCLEKQKFI